MMRVKYSRDPRSLPARKLNRRQVKQVQKIVNSNMFLKQTYLAVANNTAVASTGTLLEITAIPDGDAFNQRESNRLRLLSYNAKYQFRNSSSNTISSGTETPRLRMLIVRSKQGPLVLADLPTTVTGLPDLDRMQVYHDRVHYLPYFLYTGTTEAGNIPGDLATINDIQDFKSFHNKKTPHLNVGFDLLSDEFANVNPIYILFITDVDSIPLVSGWTHIKFFDKD